MAGRNVAGVSNAPSQHDRDEARRREALETLDRVQHHRETIGSSVLAGAARRAAAHFSAADAPDRIELWGRRIGRALSLVGVLGLAIYLYLTYLR
jgi:hypothetical protein